MSACVHISQISFIHNSWEWVHMSINVNCLPYMEGTLHGIMFTRHQLWGMGIWAYCDYQHQHWYHTNVHVALCCTPFWPKHPILHCTITNLICTNLYLISTHIPTPSEASMQAGYTHKQVARVQPTYKIIYWDNYTYHWRNYEKKK